MVFYFLQELIETYSANATYFNTAVLAICLAYTIFRKLLMVDSAKSGNTIITKLIVILVNKTSQLYPFYFSALLSPYDLCYSYQLNPILGERGGVELTK